MIDTPSLSLKDFKTWPGPKAGPCVSRVLSRATHINPATSQCGRWMRVSQRSLSYRAYSLTEEEGGVCVGGVEVVVGGSVQVWAAHSFCMSVSFHNSSAERDCQASLQLQRSISACHPAITTER